MLIALIKKDIRICRLPILIGLLLLAAPFVLSWALIRTMPLWTEAVAQHAWAAVLGTGCYFSLLCSFPTLAMISGCIIAAERADRSAEFLAYLPPSRRQILVSKFLVLLTTLILIWGTNLAIFLLANWLEGETDAASTVMQDFSTVRIFLVVGIAGMGSGWLGSAISNNTGPAVGLAFITPVLIMPGIYLISQLTNWPSPLDYEGYFIGCCLATGGLSFVLGTTYFLHRVEP